MARRAKPVVIDFGAVVTPDEMYEFEQQQLRGGRSGVRHPLEMKGLLTFTRSDDGKLHYCVGPVPQWRIRRARRILWECQQRPDWPHRPHTFFRHPALKNVPYPVLKQLFNESERR